MPRIPFFVGLLFATACPSRASDFSPLPDVGAQTVTTMKGLVVAGRALTSEQKTAAEMQGLCPVSPAALVHEEKGASVYLIQAATISIVFNRDILEVDPKTFALYKWDGHLWTKDDIESQSISPMTGNKYHAMGLYHRDGLFVAMGRLASVPPAGAYKITKEHRLKVLRAEFSKKSLDEQWFDIERSEVLSKESMKGEGPYSAYDSEFSTRLVITPSPTYAARARLYLENDGVLMMEFEQTRRSVEPGGPEQTKRFLTSMRTISGSWDTYRQGARLVCTWDAAGWASANEQDDRQNPFDGEAMIQNMKGAGTEIMKAERTAYGFTSPPRVEAQGLKLHHSGREGLARTVLWARPRP